ncbi:hypothetical protein I302_108324 [Kwoniella bestiolae CBS 10118]|uniref:Glycoside hydrolase family 5 domain-containing protein n=1 Tax=Kwoniella bestiolae CBS 10118 TaxID=1296100 RepID=A0A1B9FW03_9TREE|nr:hypothetical protein I302_07306 [Kwoniella bestiolae CBS 10118]OCF22956.1 hypothetical protein I302_07306 [Kwoniella bestiolae CBS 10118]
MVLIDLQKVLSTLGLVSSLAKPIPLVGGLAGGVLDSTGSVVSGVQSGGALNGLLGGAGGGLIAAVNFDESESNSTSISSSDPSYTAASSDDGNVSVQDSCSITPYSPPSPVLLEPFAPYDANKALIYRYRQQQSVNLGSWFVQEQWMNPSLFTCASGNKQAEFDIANGWGSVDNARQVLERHWDEWITEDDFKYLAGVGINTVRLPIGYWSLGPVYCQGTAFESVSAAYVNSWPRVVRAINWAEKYGLGVLVDLHGAPGSQNGQAHSGVSDGQQNLFSNPTNIQLTINILTYLTQQLVKVNNVVGIQILNEPSNVDSLPSFYTQVLGVLRQVSPEASVFPFYLNDAFDMSRFADYISTRKDFVVLDHHSYFVFGDANSQATPANQLTASLTPGQGGLSQQIIGASNEGRRNIVIDEFSCALSGQALSNSQDQQGDRRAFCTGQMESYTNATAGYSFWSYKTENCASDVNWCFTSAVGNTLPSTFYSYPKSTIQAIQGGVASSASQDPATDTSFLSFGTSSPSSDNDYSPPTTDDWLAAMGASDPEYDQVTEALATTEFDSIPDSPASASPSSSIEDDSDAVSANYDDSSMTTTTLWPTSTSTPSTYDTGALAQAAFVAGSRVDQATVPSSRQQLTKKRSLGLTSLPQRAFLVASQLQRHRFVARSARAHSRKHSRAIKRDGSESAVVYTPEQAAIAKGYSDGWKAAKTFAAFDNSRLGFTGQFISDALNAMDNKIVSGDEGFYKTWFMKGLADGEVQVIKLLAMQAQGPQ